MTYTITSGTLPAVPKDTVARGTFTTDAFYGLVMAAAPMVLGLEYSTNGTTWSSSITVLGGTPSMTSWAPDVGEYAAFELALTPTTAGTATFYVRALIGDGSGSVTTTPSFSVWLAVFAPVASGFIYQLETWNGTAWAAAGSSLVSRYSDGTSIVFLPGIGTTVTKVRIGGATGVEFTRPAAGTQSVFVKLDSNNSPVWAAWSSTGNTSGRQIAQDESGNTYLAIQATSVTLWGASGTSVIPSNATASGIFLAKLSGAGEWTATARVSMNGLSTGTLTTVSGLSIRGNVLAVTADIPATGVSSVTFGSVSLTPPTSSETRAVLAVFDASLIGQWGTIWTRGQSGVTTYSGRSSAVNSAGQVAVVTASPNGPSVGGVALTNAKRHAVALFSPTGSLLWHDGPSNTSGTLGAATVAADNGRVYLGLRLDANKTFTSGAASVTTAAGSNSYSLWALSTADGLGLWARIAESGASGSGHLTTQAGRVVMSYATDTAGVHRVKSYTTTNGTLEWTATANAFFGGLGMDAYGNARWAAGSGSGSSGLTTLTDADSTVTTLTAGSYTGTLDNLGNWGQVVALESNQGDAPPNSGPGGTANLPSAPFSPDWPTTRDEGQNFTAELMAWSFGAPTSVGQYAVLNPATGTYVIPTDGTLTFPGKGTLTIENQGGTNNTAAPDELDIMTAQVSWTANEDYYGTLRLSFRLVVTDTGGIPRIGPATTFTTTVVNDPEPPSTPFIKVPTSGEMPTIDEDAAYSQATWAFLTDPDRTGSYTWQVSAETSPSAAWSALYPPGTPNPPDWHETITSNSTPITLMDGDKVAGTIRVQAERDGLKEADIRFVPAANWNGTVSYDLRVGNGNAWSPWVSASVTVEEVADKPTDPVFALPDFDEDGTETFTVTWTDPDDDEAVGTSYTLQLGLVELVDGVVQTVNGVPVVNSFTEDDTIDVGLAIITVTEVSETATEATLQVAGKANAFGTYRLAVRVKKSGDGDSFLYSNWVADAGVIGSQPDAPTAVQGFMPTAKSGETVRGLFTTTDADEDDTSWTFTIADTFGGTYGSTVTVTGVGTLTVVDTDLSNKQAEVELVQVTGGGAPGRYEFWIKVTDNRGASSAPVRVTGIVLGAGSAVWLQRVDRASSPATVARIAPLFSITELSVTDSLDGSGGCDVTVTAREVALRAQQVGVTLAQLLDPGAVEVAVYVGADPVFVGPIEEAEWAAGVDTVTIHARGLLAYFERRVLTSETTFTNEDIADVFASLVDTTQGSTFGDLAVSTDEIGSAGQNVTVTFERGTRLSDAFGQLLDEVGAPEVWVSHDRALRAAPVRGSDRRGRVRFTSGMVTVAEWRAQVEGVITSATVVGSGTNVGSFTAPSSTLLRYGLSQTVVVADQLFSNAACEELAERIVTNSLAAAQAIRLAYVAAPDRPFTVGDVNVGDIVTVDVLDDRLGQLLGAYRVINRTLELAAEGGESYLVEVDLEPVANPAAPIGSRARHNPAVVERLSTVELLQRRG